MESSTLLGHLAVKFGHHPENLATEALHYILTRSEAAAEALIAPLNTLGASLPPKSGFRSLTVGDGRIG